MTSCWQRPKQPCKHSSPRLAWTTKKNRFATPQVMTPLQQQTLFRASWVAKAEAAGSRRDLLAVTPFFWGRRYITLQSPSKRWALYSDRYFLSQACELVKVIAADYSKTWRRPTKGKNKSTPLCRLRGSRYGSSRTPFLSDGSFKVRRSLLQRTHRTIPPVCPTRIWEQTCPRPLQVHVPKKIPKKRRGQNHTLLWHMQTHINEEDGSRSKREHRMDPKLPLISTYTCPINLDLNTDSILIVYLEDAKFWTPILRFAK